MGWNSAPRAMGSAPLKPRSGGVNQRYRAEYLRPMTESDFYSHVSLPGLGSACPAVMSIFLY